MILDFFLSLSWALPLNFRTLTCPPLKEHLNRYCLIKIDTNLVKTDLGEDACMFFTHKNLQEVQEGS